MKRRRALLDALPNILAILLAAGGNVLGNIVTDQVPPEAKRQAVPALGVVLLVLLGVSLLRRTLTGGRSRVRTWAALVLLLVYEGLWALGGLVSNVAAGNLPVVVRQYAPLVYPVLVVLALLIAALDFLAQSAPPVKATNRRHFLTELETRYSHRQHDALRGVPHRQRLDGPAALPLGHHGDGARRERRHHHLAGVSRSASRAAAARHVAPLAGAGAPAPAE